MSMLLCIFIFVFFLNLLLLSCVNSVFSLALHDWLTQYCCLISWIYSPVCVLIIFVLFRLHLSPYQHIETNNHFTFSHVCCQLWNKSRSLLKLLLSCIYITLILTRTPTPTPTPRGTCSYWLTLYCAWFYFFIFCWCNIIFPSIYPHDKSHIWA